MMACLLIPLRLVALSVSLLLVTGSAQAEDFSLPCPECPPEYVKNSAICFAKRSPDRLEACSRILHLPALPKTVKAFVQWRRGSLLSGRGEYKRALRDLEAAAQILPNHVYLRNERAWALVRVGRPLEGLADVEDLLREFPDLAHVRDTRGHIRLAQGKRGEALADFLYAFEYGDSDIRKIYACGLQEAGILSSVKESGELRMEIVKALGRCVQLRGCSPVPKVPEHCLN